MIFPVLCDQNAMRLNPRQKQLFTKRNVALTIRDQVPRKSCAINGCEISANTMFSSSLGRPLVVFTSLALCLISDSSSTPIFLRPEVAAAIADVTAVLCARMASITERQSHMLWNTSGRLSQPDVADNVPSRKAARRCMTMYILDGRRLIRRRPS